ncbi:putative protein phosphatase 2C 46 [Miscanthus floridulus]|uniref:putative protein phosphatase 2C 46 n=1 Tax=Miscanthus floridulus TaxID=154761 RepID=UPI00345AA861
MGNRVARLATPCFAPADGHAADDAHHYTDAAGTGAADDGTGVCHILSFDGREGRIHGVLLPSNQSTVGGSLFLSDRASFSGSSSFDSSNSFSFRTLQPRQYSGPLDSYGGSSSIPSPSTSRSATNSGVSSVSRLPASTDEQILADLYDTRHRRRQASCKSSPLLGGLRRAVASVLRAGPCVYPGGGNEHAVVTHAVAVGNGAPDVDGGAARVQWARGKAGEDRVHVVVSEEHRWMFVGIYDGFNGPDATDYLVAHLYAAVCRELDGVLLRAEQEEDDDEEAARCNGCAGARARDHDVLDATARALRSTEAEARAAECPELAMMGSCVLVALVKGADVYVMNVDDSRAEPDLSCALVGDLAGVKEEIKRQFDACEMGDLVALQLTMDHSTSVFKEARRIRSEHPDDPACIVNGRVKGSLKVTRAFGAGYLKEPRWNKALLEVFRVKYVGTSPYISCQPYLRHHRVGPRDKFMILASDGLYDYLSNEEVEAFTASYPDEGPAKYLSHDEILLRAATNAGMGFHELLEVQQGDRRRYHDDVSIIIIISLEGKIWSSS